MLAVQVVVIIGVSCFLVWAKGNAKKPPVKPRRGGSRASTAMCAAFMPP